MTATRGCGHVVVVGAGIVGLACARRIQKAGGSVTLLDPNGAGQGASLGNAGLIAGGGAIPVSAPGFWRALPKMLFGRQGPAWVRLSYLLPAAAFLLREVRESEPTRFAAASRAFSRLSLPAFDQWMTLLDDAPEARQLFHRTGTLHLYPSGQDRRTAQHKNALQRRAGVEIQDLSAAELRRILPALRYPVAGAALFSNAGHVDSPASLSRTLYERILEAGGQLIRARATGFQSSGDSVRAVTTADGDIDCDAAVVAAGAFSKPLARKLGVEVPLYPERGYHIHVASSGSAPALPVLIPSRGVAATPMEGGVRIAGLVELAGFRAGPNSACIKVLMHQAEQLIPGLGQYPEKEWMGSRPSIPGALPAIGPAPRYPNAVFAFGHGHAGLTQAPVTAEIVAASLAGTPPPTDTAPYLPERFSALPRFPEA